MVFAKCDFPFLPFLLHLVIGTLLKGRDVSSSSFLSHFLRWVWTHGYLFSSVGCGPLLYLIWFWCFSCLRGGHWELLQLGFCAFNICPSHIFQIYWGEIHITWNIKYIKVNNSVTFRTFTVLHNQNLDLVLIHFLSHFWFSGAVTCSRFTLYLLRPSPGSSRLFKDPAGPLKNAVLVCSFLPWHHHLASQ